MKTIAIFLTALTVMATFGCHPNQSMRTVEDFERHYTSTRWYWSKYQATPSDLTGFRMQDNQGMQAFLTSSNGTHIIYSELETSNFMKSFSGIGKLKELPDVPESIFERDCDYTQRNPSKLLLIGFVGSRAIQIEATHSRTNRPEVMAEAISVARQMYNQLKGKEASNQEMHRTK